MKVDSTYQQNEVWNGMKLKLK